MTAYILKRVLQLIPVLFGISVITFSLIYLIPGDPVRLMMGQHQDPEVAAAIRHELGLDKPIPVQYARYVTKAVQGDLGRSYVKRIAVRELLKGKFQATLVLTMAAMVLAIFIGVIAGLVSAAKPNSLSDYMFMVLAIVGISLPVFWLGLMLQILANNLNAALTGEISRSIIPISGYFDPRYPWFVNLKYLILPAITLATVPMAIIARMVRSSMLEVMNLEYIRTARAKGLTERIVVMKHALKNALIPIITVIGNNFALLLTGAVLTETVFSWPGMGRLMVDAIIQRDFPVVMGGVIVMSVVFVVVNLIVDILYASVDPRIRYG